MASEHTLVDIPSAATSFYADDQTPRIPALAVAVGPNVFIYRNLRPYFKFTLSPETVSEVEKSVWYATPRLLLLQIMWCLCPSSCLLLSVWHTLLDATGGNCMLALWA